jgi:hypothetical protein
MSVFENAGAWDQSNTEVRGELVARYEKGGTDAALRYIDYGAIALCRDVIAERPLEPGFGLDRVQTELASLGKLRACVATQRFYEVGSELGISDLETLLSSK